MLNALSVLLIGFGLVYFLSTMTVGRRNIRRAAGEPAAVVGAAAGDFDIYFLIACLDEETVISDTVHRLVRQPGARVVVVDDGSADRTSSAAEAAGRDRVLVVQRWLPDARAGKGPALNAGFAHLVHDVRERGLNLDRVLVCVMDADGHLSEGAVEHVAALFAVDDVGGVQLAVRIRNRDRVLTRLQDLEFWGLSATSQFGRASSGTVSLGGNGQFTRLSALVGLGRPPWSSSLTEDLDLAITLMLEGWRLTTTPLAWVDQQGVESVRGLARQRTRWMQGHMTCGARIPALWGSARLSNLAVLETTIYLLIPWLLVLPWSIIFHLGVYQLVMLLIAEGGTGLFGDSMSSRVVYGAAWYVASFFPNIASGYLYYRRDPSVGRVRALLLGHALLPLNYIAYVSCWRALLRMLRGRRGWDKTERTVELQALQGALS